MSERDVSVLSFIDIPVWDQTKWLGVLSPENLAMKLGVVE